jgi:hypothetical protein
MTRVLYLHGFASGVGSSKAQYFRERLEAMGARVEIPDLAAGDFEGLTISGQLAVVEHAAGGEPVVVMGSSMGGYLAALYASRHPEVEKLVLMAPAFGFARRWPESFGEAKMKAWRETGYMNVFHFGERGIRRVGIGLLEDAARYPDYPDFRQPGLIFHGTADDVVRARWSEEFAAGHPNVKLYLMDSDHQLLNVLDEMMLLVAEFLG